jgi:phosphatidylserine synthase
MHNPKRRGHAQGMLSPLAACMCSYLYLLMHTNLLEINSAFFCAATHTYTHTQPAGHVLWPSASSRCIHALRNPFAALRCGVWFLFAHHLDSPGFRHHITNHRAVWRSLLRRNVAILAVRGRQQQWLLCMLCKSVYALYVPKPE